MISNERPSPYGHRHQPWQHSTPPSNEEMLRVERVHIERKTFVFMLKENPRGRFLRITEDVQGRREAIIVPATGLEEFCRMLGEMAKASVAAPARETEPPPAD
ncbi:MAG: RNA-binding protein [Verrucomicrobia bacterium]|nr:RNA-binding protein [Verrucomicrobiota bacterium]